MIKNNFTNLMNFIGISGRELAEYAGINPSIISRLKTGERNPDYSSTTTTKIINGFSIWCSEKEMEHQITEFLKSQNILIENNNIRTGMLRYLYNDNLLEYTDKKAFKKSRKPSGSSASYENNSEHFSNRLRKVMSLAKLSNIQLSRAINVDPSYISRFRNGKRVPGINSKLMEPMCLEIFEKINIQGNSDKLAELMNITPDTAANKDFFYIAFKEYLTVNNSNRDSIFHFLQTIDSAIPMNPDIYPSYKEVADFSILEDTDESYFGNEGFRRAVERFLLTVLEKDIPEIYIYSDEDMTWMIQDENYYKKWVILMTEIIKKGTKIKIIHNIDRSITEMINGIESWLPLYMIGNIQPYYLDTKNGNRFTHTIIIAPGECSIASCNIKGIEELGMYYFKTDKSTVNKVTDGFIKLINSGNPLARFIQGENDDSIPDNKTKSSEFPNIRISVSAESVYVSKLSEPSYTIIIYHPLMCEAMRVYIEHLDK